MVMIRIIRDGEVLKETENIQTLVQYIDFYDTETKYLEIKADYDKIEERNRRNIAKLSD